MIPWTDRTDYVAAPLNNLGYILAVEKLVGITATERAQYWRVIMAELSRIASEHPEALVAAVTHGDVIRALLAAYAGMPLDCMLRLEVAPASVSAVRLGSEPLVLAVNWLTDGIGGIGPWDLPAR